jgi:hypothetical protein
MFDQKAGVLDKHRIWCRHSIRYHQVKLLFTSVLERSDLLKSADPMQEFIHVLDSSPLAIADYIQTRLFLEANGKCHHVIHNFLETLLWDLLTLEM